jgi:hypothetical protein
MNATKSRQRSHAGTIKIEGEATCMAATKGASSTKLPKLEWVRAQKGLALPRASHPGEIALAGSRRLHSTLAAAPVLFAHDAVTVAEKNK